MSALGEIEIEIDHEEAQEALGEVFNTMQQTERIRETVRGEIFNTMQQSEKPEVSGETFHTMQQAEKPEVVGETFSTMKQKERPEVKGETFATKKQVEKPEVLGTTFTTRKQTKDALPSQEELQSAEKRIVDWLKRQPIDVHSIRSPASLESMYLRLHSSDQRVFAAFPDRFTQLFVKEFAAAKERDAKNVSALEQRIAHWLQHTEINADTQSAHALKNLYLQRHTKDSALLAAHSDRFDNVFADAHMHAKQQQIAELKKLEGAVQSWLTKESIHTTTIRSWNELKIAYLRKHPQNKAVCEHHSKRFDPLFVAAYKKAVETYEKIKKQAKAQIAKSINTLLKPDDIENDSLKTQTLFVAAMLSRLQSTLMQHRNPDALYKELETYAKVLIEKLHVVWLKKHEAKESEAAKKEVSQIEKAVSSLQLSPDRKITSFDELKKVFQQEYPQDIFEENETLTNALLKITWAKHSALQDAPEQEPSQETEPATVQMDTPLPTHTYSTQINTAMMETSSEMEEDSPVSTLDDSVVSRFSSVDWNTLTPTLTSFLHQSRLHIGSERVRRLAQLDTVETLFSGREEKLAPFMLAMCGVLENEGEIQRCIRELALSDSPKDTIRIMLASDECRRAAYRVQQSPLIWSRFVDSLSSLGVSLKDLHLHSDDEELSDQEIDAEMMQEVAQEVIAEDAASIEEEPEDPDNAENEDEYEYDELRETTRNNLIEAGFERELALSL